MIYLLIPYLGLCLALALAGRGTRGGIVGTFLLSLLFTPVVTILYLLAFRPRRLPRWETRPRQPLPRRET